MSLPILLVPLFTVFAGEPPPPGTYADDFEIMRPDAPVEPAVIAPAPTPTPTQPEPTQPESTQPEAVVPGPEAAAAAESEPPPPKEKPPGTGLIVGGALLTTVGVAGVGVLTAGGVMARSASDDLPNTEPGLAREETFEQGATGNTLMIVGSVMGGVGLAAGVAMLAAGGAKRAAWKRERSAAVPNSVAPMITRDGAGLVLGWTF